MSVYKTAATMVATSTYWLVENGVSVVALQWGLSTVPPVVCLLAVHVVCRNFFTIMWASAKLLLAALVYIHIRDLMETSLVPRISIESMLFGVPTDTSTNSLPIGFEMVRMHALVFSRTAIAGICPSCIPVPEPPTPEPEEEHTQPIGWVDWIADTIRT
jgi:hypothetical protein